MWAWIQEKDVPSNPGVGEKAVSNSGLNCGYHTILLTSPKTVGGLLWFPYRPPKCWPEINRLPDISPTKMDLFKVSRELQFEVCNHCEPHKSSCTRKGKHFYRGERKSRGYSQKRVCGFSLAESLPGKKRSASSSCWALIWSQVMRVPPSGLSAFV